MNGWETTDDRAARMSRLRRRDTAPELALRRELHRRGRRFFVDRRVATSTRARVDIVFPRPRIAVFVDGCFWHYCDEHTHIPRSNSGLWLAKLLANRRRDAANTERMRREGWLVLRFWEHDDPADAADVIERAIDRWHRITRRQLSAPSTSPMNRDSSATPGIDVGNEVVNPGE
jgi:DNA mismatch endonuclease, patch repair protein